MGWKWTSPWRAISTRIALGFTTTEEAIDITDRSQVIETTPTSLADLAKQSMDVEDVKEEDESQEQVEAQPTTLFEDED